MKQYRSHGDNYTDGKTLATWLDSNKPFTNSNRQFRGIYYLGNATNHELVQAWLPTDEWTAFKLRANGIDYVVLSYNTIIAYRWCGSWHVPDCKYSRTTTGHQSMLAWAIQEVQKHAHAA
jgi:hypothetical protein